MTTKKKTSFRMLAARILMVPAYAFLLMSFVGKDHRVEPKPRAITQNIAVQNIPDIAPVELKKVTLVVMYGDILDPETNKRRNHTGIDFQLQAGSDVIATADGVVVRQAFGEKQGNFIVIRHDENYSTRYFHLQQALVGKGAKIKKGQVIGLVGNTGLSSTPHLHYEILKNYKPVDPKSYLPKLPGS